METKGPYDLAFMWPYSWPFYKVNFMLIFFKLTSVSTTLNPSIPVYSQNIIFKLLLICIFCVLRFAFKFPVCFVGDVYDVEFKHKKSVTSWKIITKKKLYITNYIYHK